MAGYVYLDSNVFWRMKPDNKPCDFALRQLIEKLRGRYKFPFSEAHLRDLAMGDKPENKDFIQRDLAFLSEVSQNLAVGQSDDQVKPPEHCQPMLGPIEPNVRPWILLSEVDVTEEYRIILQEKPEKMPPLVIEGKIHAIDVDKIPSDNPMRRLLIANAGFLSPKVLMEYAEHLYDNYNDPDVYRSFRKSVSYALKGRLDSGTVMSSIPGLIEKISPIQKFLLSKKSEDIAAILPDALEAIRAISGKASRELRWTDKLMHAYALLDFHTDMWDKIKKENLPRNMMVDANHLVGAARAEYFVTEDLRLKSKAKVLFSAFGIRTVVLDASEFRERFFLTEV